MSSPDSHLSDELLLMELEGELGPRETRAAQEHLQACGPCHARRQELERSIADFIRVYQQELETPLPSADGPRALLRAQLAEISGQGRMAAPRLSLLALAALVLLLAGWLALGPGSLRRQPPADALVSTPDLRLTPGATILLSQGAVCSQANIKNKEVPATVQRAVFQEYGLSQAQRRSYEVDYLVTPALGGSDDIHNLWPHSYSTLWNARVKDDLEDRLREMVCSGTLDLAQAQHEIASNWIEAYKKYFHTDQPLPEHRRE